MKIISAAVILVLLSVAGVHAQDSDEIKQLKVVADSGDYTAAHQLGFAYAAGAGVKQDKKAADYWYSVAASRRATKTLDQASPNERTTTTDTSTAAGTLNPAFYIKPSSVEKSSPGHSSDGGDGVSTSSVFNSKPATPQTTAEVSTWKKVVDAVAAVPAKTKEFLSDHTDEIEDIATMAIEHYTGAEPSEGNISKAEASAAGRTLQQYGEQQKK